MYSARDTKKRRGDEVMRFIRRAVPIVAVVLLLASTGRAEDQFRDLVGRLPRTTNAVAIFNMEKIKRSPMAIKEGYAENMEQAYRSGLVRIPPRATRFVTAAEIDIEFMTPVYEVAVFDLDRQPSITRIAQEYSGTTDTLNGLAAVKLTTDTYVVQLDRQTVGVMRPANRQAVLRWVRDSASASRPKLSRYLQKAAGYSDDAGTDIILAVDIDGAFSLEHVVKYLKGKQAMLDEAKVRLDTAARVLRSVDGLRVGIKIGEKPVGRIVVDFQDPVSLPTEFAKTLLLEIIADVGAQFDDLDSWKCKVGSSEISLSGYPTRDGLRRLVSLIDSPAPAHATAESKGELVSPGEAKTDKVTTSLEYFQTIESLFRDLRRDWKSLKTLASGSLYLDRYARRIEKLPMLNVDSDLLDYGQYVAGQLRAASRAVRTMGIRGGARQAQISGYDANPTASWGAAGGHRSYYGGYRFGWARQDYYSGHDVIKQVGDKRRQIRAQEKAVMATDVYTIRDKIIDATNEVRRGLTERYQTQF